MGETRIGTTMGETRIGTKMGETRIETTMRETRIGMTMGMAMSLPFIRLFIQIASQPQ